VRQGQDVPNMEELRQQALHGLIEGIESGAVDSALAGLKRVQPGSTLAPPDEAPDEALRLQVKDVLMNAAKDGQLDSCLASAKQDDSSIDDLRQQAKSTLLEAMSNGQLEQTMGQIKGSAESDPLEALRQEVKGVLLDAASDGRLQDKLTDLKAGGEVNEVEDLRVKAQSAILTASKDGRLIDALADCSQVPAPGALNASSSSLGPSSPINASELQASLADGLRDAINDSVKGAVGDVVNNAFTELKAEMAKRDAQAEILATQMTELHRAVTDLQTTVEQQTSPLSSPMKTRPP